MEVYFQQMKKMIHVYSIGKGYFITILNTVLAA